MTRSGRGWKGAHPVAIWVDEPAMGVTNLLEGVIPAIIEAEHSRVESLLAEAMVLQDFDHLDRLATIRCDGVPTTVGSLFPEGTR